MQTARFHAGETFNLSTPIAGLFIPIGLLQGSDPTLLGFKPLREGDELTPDGILVADITHPQKVVLADRRVSVPPKWVPLIEADFPDRHPRRWTQECVDAGLLLVLTHPKAEAITDLTLEELATQSLWTGSPLAIRETADGLTVAPRV